MTGSRALIHRRKVKLHLTVLYPRRLVVVGPDHKRGLVPDHFLLIRNLRTLHAHSLIEGDSSLDSRLMVADMTIIVGWSHWRNGLQTTQSFIRFLHEGQIHVCLRILSFHVPSEPYFPESKFAYGDRIAAVVLHGHIKEGTACHPVCLLLDILGDDLKSPAQVTDIISKFIPALVRR